MSAICHHTMSLDGFIAGRDDSAPLRLPPPPTLRDHVQLTVIDPSPLCLTQIAGVPPAYETILPEPVT